MLTSPEAKDAVQQVHGYCSRRGVELAVVTNGRQIIAFAATRNDGVPPLNGNCFVIDGLDRLRAEFSKLWQVLSPAGVAENKLKQFLRLGDEPKIPQKVSSTISNYPNFRMPTREQRDLQIISDLLLTEAPEWTDLEKEFYARCYCKSRELSEYSLVSRQILEARYAELFVSSDAAPTVVPMKKTSWKGVLASDVIAESLSQRPIILLGDVGVGKTSFLKNLMYVDAVSELEHTICIYIDLGSKGALDEDMRRFLLTEIENQLRRKYRIDIMNNDFILKVYAEELARFQNGIFGAIQKDNPALFLQKRVEFLAEKICVRYDHIGNSLADVMTASQRQIVIVLDNSDQRSIEIQVEVLAIAHELTKSWGALVFVAMRPQTIFKFEERRRLFPLRAHFLNFSAPH